MSHSFSERFKVLKPMVWIVGALVIASFLFFGSSDVRSKPPSQANNWKEVEFPASGNEGVKWCGPSKLLVEIPSTKELRIIDMVNGKVKDFPTRKFLSPSCSPDGRYVFFTDAMKGSIAIGFTFKNLFAFKERKNMSYMPQTRHYLWLFSNPLFPQPGSLSLVR